MYVYIKHYDELIDLWEGELCNIPRENEYITIHKNVYIIKRVVYNFTKIPFCVIFVSLSNSSSK